jgi:hypothetical protein
MLLNREGVEREGTYGVSSVELYATSVDPSELEDVSEEHPEALEGLMQAVAEWERLFPLTDG